MTNTYKIKVRGHLDQAWLDYWCDSLTVTYTDNGETLITGPIIDQPALHGLLRRIGDLGLTLLLVEQMQPDSLQDV